MVSAIRCVFSLLFIVTVRLEENELWKNYLDTQQLISNSISRTKLLCDFQQVDTSLIFV